jgi:hypothetical protein
MEITLPVRRIGLAHRLWARRPAAPSLGLRTLTNPILGAVQWTAHQPFGQEADGAKICANVAGRLAFATQRGET